MENLPDSIQVISDRVERYKELKEGLEDVKDFLDKDTPNEIRLSNNNFEYVDIDREYLYMFMDTLEAYVGELKFKSKNIENKFDSYVEGE